MIHEDVDIQVDVHTKCRNCSNDFVGMYCNACGQKKSERISFKHLGQEISKSIFDIEQGLLYTVIQLSKYPGKTVVDYIQGKRKIIYGPAKYLMLWSATFFVITALTRSADKPVSLTSLINNDHQLFSIESFDDFAALYFYALSHYTHIFYLGVAPIFAFLCFKLFRSKGFSFIELILPYLYLSGHLACFLVVSSIAIVMLGPNSHLALMFLSFIFFIYMLLKMHKEIFGESWTKTIIKSLVIIYAGQIIYLGAGYLLLNLLKLIV